MGITQSSISTSKNSDHPILGLANHPILGLVNLHESNKTNCLSQTLQVCYRLLDSNPMNEWLNILNCHFDGIMTNEYEDFFYFQFDQGYQHQRFRFSSLLFPIKYSWRQQGIFTKSGSLKIHFQNFAFTLQQQILKRLDSANIFKQTEIWLLIYKLLELQSNFQSKNTKIGNIHPSNILIKKNFFIKVFSKYSSIEGKTNLESKLQDINCKAFLAPEQIKILNRKEKDYKSQKQNISEVYSIGLTVLCMAMLLKDEDFYTVEKGSQNLKIRLDKIEMHLETLRLRYSSFLYNFMVKILQPNPLKRSSASTMYRSIKEYQEDILRMRRFLPEIKKKVLVQTPLSQNLKGVKQTAFLDHLQNFKRGTEFRESQERKLLQFYKKYKHKTGRNL